MNINIIIRNSKLMASAAEKDTDFTLIPDAIATSGKSREELLEDYIEIPKAKWNKMIKGMQIRVECNDGKIRTGGFLIGIVLDENNGDTDTADTVATDSATTLPTDTSKKVFLVSNFVRHGPGYKEFRFKWKVVTHVWKHLDRFSYFEIMRLSDVIAEQYNDVQRLKKKTAALESAISKLIEITGIRGPRH